MQSDVSFSLLKINAWKFPKRETSGGYRRGSSAAAQGIFIRFVLLV